MKNTAIAHVRKNANGSISQQTVAEHLEGVARRVRSFAEVVRLPKLGELLGLLHDLGKYSGAFQSYIGSAEGLIDPDSDDYVEASGMRGKIDHSTAGAQLAWNRLMARHGYGRLAGELAAFALASHHSGLIDGLSPDGENIFATRIGKPDNKTHCSEALSSMDAGIRARIKELLSSPSLLEEIGKAEQSIASKESVVRLRSFHRGLLERFLFSCLLDADRLDSADFENPEAGAKRPNGVYPRWSVLIERLETHLASFYCDTKVKEIRKNVSEACAAAGAWEKGTYNLTVPTGGGKTLASLRFALLHAEEHKMERIIFVIPITSIIEQNAAVVRDIMETRYLEEPGSIVLEHHSNLMPELDSWIGKLLAENWDAPIVFTTNVQVLESMFAKGTRSARRFHQLGKSILIFDEAQAIPINCVHMFNNAINFLVKHCDSTAVLCTATQPLLHKVDAAKGALHLADPAEIAPDTASLFAELKRVEIIDRRRSEGWSFKEAVDLGVRELEERKSLLYVVNTKRSAAGIFRELKTRLGSEAGIFHLSTNMCPAHRKQVLDQVRVRLDKKESIVCVSTQLIEAGVDIDFDAVIRGHAGLDSIAQAAGRCNRNGRAVFGKLSIINLADEDVSSLHDIREGQEAANRVLDDFASAPENFDRDLISPRAIERYYEYYFWQRADIMAYQVGSNSPIGRNDDLLTVLSENPFSFSAYSRTHYGERPKLILRQSFNSAAESFKALDAPTEAVLVPWGRGKDIIGILNSSASFLEKFLTLKTGQLYSVALRSGAIEKLKKLNLIKEIGDLGILELIDERYYSQELGLIDRGDGRLSFLGA